MSRFALGRTLKGGWKNVIKHSLQRFVYTAILKKPDIAKIFEIYQKSAGKYSGNNTCDVAHQAFGYNPHYIWSASDWKETVMLPFEDTMLCAPKHYDAILRHQYGDYMQIPEDKSTHIYHSFDPDVPYTLFFIEQQ